MFIHFVQMHNKRKSVPVSGSGTKGETSPHSTKILPSGHRAQTKKEQLSPRKPLQALFFFVPGAARFFFSRKRKRNVGRKRSPLFQEEKKTPLRGATIPLFFQEGNQKAVGLSSAEMYGILIAALPKNGRRLALNSFSGMMEGYVLCPSERGAAYGYIFGSDSDRYLNRWHYRPVFSGQ